MEQIYIKGTEVAYYIICQRKLWLFSNFIQLEKYSDFVEIGKIISEESFKREKFKEIEIDSIKIDFLKFGNEIIVNEVKKSKKLEEAHIWQVKYYIYYLKKMGINCNMGIIRYPKLLKKIDVDYNIEDEKEIEKAIMEINKIKEGPAPPPVINKPYCKKCAYFEFCFI